MINSSVRLLDNDLCNISRGSENKIWVVNAVIFAVSHVNNEGLKWRSM